ncbi:MAG: ImmA/IrrE family metallo-endopeptidase [Synergistales bacterium]|nr:ImmA/IrrE family metallo-endopeptidase [Synergistales bacterium]
MLPDRERSPLEAYHFPEKPERIPQWALEEGRRWHRLDEFEIVVEAERRSGRRVDVEYTVLTPNIWGLHVARGERACIYVNSDLPPLWRRFTLFHELYHLLQHRRGESFWARTATPLSSFEHQADMFAWGAILPEWAEWDGDVFA